MSRAAPVDDEPPAQAEPALPLETGDDTWFHLAELRRVGTAATMVVVCGTVIIITMTMAMGHYNSLAHSGPKAVLDGAVIGLLMGQRGRWRCLALLGTVYGLVLLLQIGVVYLMPVMVVAGVIAAVTGRIVSVAHRHTALLAAAIAYELLAGFGAPIKIYFGTGGRDEPFLWGMWFAEWPIRIVGATAGVWLATRWASRRKLDGSIPTTGAASAADSAIDDESLATAHHAQLPRAKGIGPAALRLVVSILACIVPMLSESGRVLGVLALAYIAYGLWAGLRWRVLHALIGLLWGWLVFGLFSYLWHQETERVIDMLRTLVLRFLPITISSMVLVSTTRPVDVVRLLRRLGFGRAVLLPLSSVIRDLPASRRDLRQSMARLRREGIWTGPLSLFRRPVPLIRGLFGPRIRRWADQLAER